MGRSTPGSFNQGTAHTRSQIGYPKPREKFGMLTGARVIGKLRAKMQFLLRP
jgi:hypothetical protein